jgi:putative cell wall-binding protein/alpha-tubulin suppressor-like RCC1 family protein
MGRQTKMTSILLVIVLLVSYLPQPLLSAVRTHAEGSSLYLTREEVKQYEGLVAAELGRSLVVVEDGTIQSSSDAGINEIVNWRDIVKLDSNNQLTIALKKDGTAEITSWNDENDSRSKAVEQWSNLVDIATGGEHAVGLTADGTVLVAGKLEYGPPEAQWNNIIDVAAGARHTVGLKANGTVVAAGDNRSGQGNVGNWTDIVAVDGGFSHTVGLKKDGTVVAVGENSYGQTEVSGWQDIVAISAGESYTVGLKSDGTVVATRGYDGQAQNSVSGWTDIVAIAAGVSHTVGLRADGSVVAAGGNNWMGPLNVNGWQDIVAADSYGQNMIGLKGDGTVVTHGVDHNGKLNVANWTDIVSVAAGYLHNVGLKKDGKVVAVGSEKFNAGQTDVRDWRDITAIAAGYQHTVGLKKDGTVVAVGYNYYGQTNVSEWKDIVAIGTGSMSTVGLKGDGTVVTAGYNSMRMLDVSDWNDIVAISVGLNHTVGLKADGTVVTAGETGNGEGNVGSWTDIVAIYAGAGNTIGIKADGTVVGTGKLWSGRTSVEGWTDIVSVTGRDAIVGLKRDGTVVANGDNVAGELNVTPLRHYINGIVESVDVSKSVAQPGKQVAITVHFSKKVNSGVKLSLRGAVTTSPAVMEEVPGTAGLVYQSTVDLPQGSNGRIYLQVSDIVGETGFRYADAYANHYLTVDGEAPGLYGIGDVAVNLGSPFDPMAGVVAYDQVEGRVTGQVEVTGSVNFSKKGSYPLTYTVADQSGNSAVRTRMVTVVDSEKPVIHGLVDVTIPVGEAFDAMAGVTATDNADGDLTAAISIDGSVDTAKPGVYSLTYTVADSAGNRAEASRTVTVFDNVAPIISGIGDLEISLGDSFDPKKGVFVRDNVDGDLTFALEVSGKVDTSKPGTYQLVYSVMDSAGNRVEQNRTVVVVDTVAPMAPSVNKVSDLDMAVTGTAENGASVIATIGGVEIGRTTADRNGNFSIKITTQQAGSTIEVVAVDASGNRSPVTKVRVTDELPKLNELIGETRYTTAVEISKAGWQSADTVFLVNGRAIADGLTATPLASALDAPILLTTADVLPAETLAEIQRLNAKNIVLIGGSTVISDQVSNFLSRTGYHVSRIGGLTRYETSLLIAQELDRLVDVHTVYVAYGFGEPDALSIAAQSGHTKQPIILTGSSALPDSTYQWLKGEALTTAYFIGGSTVLHDSILSQLDSLTAHNVQGNRISGATRQETNAKVIQTFYRQQELPALMVAHSSTEKLVDALAAGPLAAKLNVPVLLVSSWIDPTQTSVISDKKALQVNVIGGGIDPSVTQQIIHYMN